MKFLLFILALLTLLFDANSLLAATEDRPKIGVVLSGGGARGAAHVGVLKVLEEYRIPIDMVTGTSMGSIVGGLYASGMSPDEIGTVLAEMDWPQALTNNVPRADQNYINKLISEKFSTNLKLGVDINGVLLPSGAIQGQNVVLALQAFSAHVAHVANFDELPIPFRAIATNIVSGDMVVLSGGSIARAMQASMSVPGVFSPVIIDGLTLVDGGLSNNLPVDIAREMGADIIIAIDISTPLLGADEVVNILDISIQLTGFLTRTNTEQRLRMLTEEDVLIMPELGDLSSSAFERATEAIPLGEIAARASEAELRALSVSETEYAAYRASFRAIPPVNTTIRSITIENDSGLNDDMITRRITTIPGDDLDIDKIAAEVNLVHAIGNFETVGYRLNHRPEGIDLLYDANAKSWGPNYVYMGMTADGDLEGNSTTNFDLGFSREELNDRGAIWTTKLSVGEEPGIETQWYQPLGYGLGPFLLASAGTSRDNRSVFDGDDKLLEYRLKQSEASIGLGYEFSARAALLAGVDRLDGRADVLIGDPMADEPEFDDGGFFLRYRYDSMDDRFFPTSGTLIDAWVHESFTSLGADEEVQQWKIRAVRINSYGQHRFGFSLLVAGTENGSSVLGRRFNVAGVPDLAGLKPDQLIGQHAAVIKVLYYREYSLVTFLSGYIGGSLSYGGAWEDRDDISSDSAVGSASVFAAVDSPLGPIQLGVGFSDQGDINYFTRIGFLF